MEHRTESLVHAGLPWPVVFDHQSMDSLASVGHEPTSTTLRRFAVRVEPKDGGPSTPEAFAEWADYHPAQVSGLLGAMVAAHQPTTRERLFLRVTVWSRPGDGVWDLPSGTELPWAAAQALGLVANHPMPKAYGTRWDTDCPRPEVYSDEYIEEKANGRGIGCRVHPRLASVVCPRLRGVVAYHALARPPMQITREEYQTMSAYEVFCHRLLRDTQSRR